MKKRVTILTAALAVFALSACSPSNISSAETSPVPEGVVAATEEEDSFSIKDIPTEEYTIPDDAPTGVAGGPGMIETSAVDNSSYYPEDKQSGNESDTVPVCLYAVDDTGVVQNMADAASSDADGIIAAMVDEGILAEGTEVSAFSQEGTTASITLNQLVPVYAEASEEQILACVVNTLTENLGLESISVKAGEQDFGEQVYTNEYDAT